nr:response regulator [Planctomycetota bacterium]
MTVRVLVADDSLTVRRHMVQVLAAEPGIQVIGEASDGNEAVDLCRRLRPDVVTLDILMPGIDGVAATERIMAYMPTPILVVCATSRGEVAGSFAALAAGAVEVLEKPHGDVGDGPWEQRLVDLVRLVARVRVLTHVRGRRDHGDPTGAHPHLQP